MSNEIVVFAHKKTINKKGGGTTTYFAGYKGLKEQVQKLQRRVDLKDEMLGLVIKPVTFRKGAHAGEEGYVVEISTFAGRK